MLQRFFIPKKKGGGGTRGKERAKRLVSRRHEMSRIDKVPRPPRSTQRRKRKQTLGIRQGQSKSVQEVQQPCVDEEHASQLAFAGYHSTAAFASPAPRTRAQDRTYVPFGIGSTYRRTASWWTTTSSWYGPEEATVLPLVQLCHSSHTGGRFSLRAYVKMCVNMGTISLRSIFGLAARK